MKYQFGFVASGRRDIKEGAAYNSLFAAATVKDTYIMDGSVNDTITHMQDIVRRCKHQTKSLAAYLKGATVDESCNNIWAFLYNHVQYKLDQKGLEQLRQPLRSWHDRETGIDCDCFSIFVSCLLTNMGIAHAFRITKYDYKPNYQHVYVIVPINGSKSNYRTIDCVLEQYNYEKPFTEQKTYYMSALGLPIAELSGPGDELREYQAELEELLSGTMDEWDTETLEVITGVGISDELDLNDDTESIGSVEAKDNALYNYLVKTREAVILNPEGLRLHTDPHTFLDMLDYAIKHWNTPQRDAALDALARAESEVNRLNGFDDDEDGVEGVDGSDEDVEIYYEPLGKTGKRQAKIKSKGKMGFFKKLGKAVKTVGNKIVKGVIRYNPLSIAARNGFLLGMKLNLFHIAAKLKPGYMTEAQAKAAGINKAQWEKHKQALKAIEKFWKNVAGGKTNKLKDAILKGKAGGLKGLGSTNGLGEPLTIAAVSAGSALLATAAGIVAKFVGGPKAQEVAEVIETSASSVSEVTDALEVEQEEQEEVEGIGDLGKSAKAAAKKKVRQERRTQKKAAKATKKATKAAAKGEKSAATRTARPAGKGAAGKGGKLLAITAKAKKVAGKVAAAVTALGPEDDSTEIPDDTTPGTPGSNTPPDETPGFFTRVGDFVKANPLPVAGGTALLAFGVYKLVTMPKKTSGAPASSTKSLEGVGKKATAKKAVGKRAPMKELKF